MSTYPHPDTARIIRCISEMSDLAAGFYHTVQTDKNALVRHRAGAGLETVKYCMELFGEEGADAYTDAIESEQENIDRERSQHESPFERMWRHIGNAVHKKESNT